MLRSLLVYVCVPVLRSLLSVYVGLLVLRSLLIYVCSPVLRISVNGVAHCAAIHYHVLELGVHILYCDVDVSAGAASV